MSEATVADAQTLAERVMYELLGQRWVGPPLRAVEAHADAPVLHLQGRPVVEILGVTKYGSVVDDGAFQLVDGYKLKMTTWLSPSTRRWALNSGSVLNAGCGYGSSDPSDRPVVIDYVYGGRPPFQIQNAINVLRTEFDLALCGKACRLPKRVTSLSREGINMTLIDPREFLEKGLVGIEEVDLAISVFNRGGAKLRAGVYGRRTPPPQRISTTVYPTGGDVPMGTSVRDLYIEQGATYTLGLVWYHQIEVEGEPAAGDPYDLTGATARLQIRQRVSSPSPTVSVSSESFEGDLPAITLGGDTGRVDVILTDVHTDALTFTRGVYDLEIVLADGSVHRLLQGAVTVSLNVTR